MRRRFIPIAAIAAVTASLLTGCSTADPAESCTPKLSPGALSDSVRVSGDTADSLRVSTAKGVETLGAQRSILAADGADGTAGSSAADATATDDGTAKRGTIVEQGMIFKANLAYVDAASGEILQIDPSFGTEQGTPYLADPKAGTIFAGVLCTGVGETAAIVYSPEESASMGVDGQLLVLAQITDASAPRAVGKKHALPSGFPAVTNDETGRPGVVLPPQQAPSKTKSAVRIEGEGDPVTAEQNVIGHVLTVGWDGKELKNTWTSLPEGFGNEESSAQSGVSFRAALTGYPVGSQVLVIEPGEGHPSVSVVDILAVI